MKKELEIVIKEIKQEMDIRLKRPNDSNPDSYMGWCKEASEIALEILHKEKYTEYQLGKCFIDDVDHWVVFNKIKYDSSTPYYSGVIDMTAIQFHNDPNVKDYQTEFKRYTFGKIPDEHSKKHYMVKNEDVPLN
jgi:hypothetical protein